METICYWEDSSWCYDSAIDDMIKEGCAEDFEEVLVPEGSLPEHIDEVVNALCKRGWVAY